VGLGGEVVSEVAQGVLDGAEDFVVGEVDEFVGEALKNGTMLDTAGLEPTKKGKRVRLSGGTLSVLDGPFTETKEVVGGYALVEAKSYEDAMKLATKFMDLHRIHWSAFEGECEVRPLEEY